MPFVPRSLSAGILRSQNSIRSPPLWETQPAGAFGDRRQIPPLKQFQGYLTSTSVRTTGQRFARLKFLTSTHTSGVQGAKPPCRGLGCPQHTSLSHVFASAGGKL